MYRCMLRQQATMSDVRRHVWATNIGKAKVKSERKVLPPTTETLEQNVRRAHIQAAILKPAVKSVPPTTLDEVWLGLRRSTDIVDPDYVAARCHPCTV